MTERDKNRAEALPTGEDTSLFKDVADPHPSREEHPYKARHPGGATTKHDMNRVNDQVHDGTPPPRPDNVETDPD